MSSPRKYVFCGIVIKHGSHGLVYKLLRIVSIPLGIPLCIKWLLCDLIDAIKRKRLGR